MLRVPEVEVVSAVARLQEQLKEAQKRPRTDDRQLAESVAASAEEIGGVRVVTQPVEVEDAKALLELSDQVKQKLGDAAVVLGSSGDGKVFLVANQKRNGVSIVDLARLEEIGFVPTGTGAHGLYPSRDSKLLYVSNRGAGTITLISFRTGRPVKTWRIPGGGSPDMGGVSADGRVLWLSGRYDGVVYAISTRTGRLLHRIRVGAGPHGLCVWPQPGRYSIGHTGILR
jgi:hypothetical protein